jgi:predicted MFS family arabinose efflux permease
LLSAGAACFVAASLLGGRLGEAGRLRTVVGWSTAALGAGVVLLFGIPVLGLDGWSAALSGGLAFCLAGVAGGLRIPAASVLGMAQHPERPDVMMAARTAAMQAGYLVGAVLAGSVVATAGWPALGPVLAIPLGLSALLMVRLPSEQQVPSSPALRPRGQITARANLSGAATTSVH